MQVHCSKPSGAFLPHTEARVNSVNSDTHVVFQGTQVKMRRLRAQCQQCRGGSVVIAITKAGHQQTAVFTESPVLSIRALNYLRLARSAHWRHF